MTNVQAVLLRPLRIRRMALPVNDALVDQTLSDPFRSDHRLHSAARYGRQAVEPYLCRPLLYNDVVATDGFQPPMMRDGGSGRLEHGLPVVLAVMAAVR